MVALYKPDVMEEILRRLADGETLREICRCDGMPAHSSVYAWVDTVPGMKERFARAREDGADAIAEQAGRILDETPERIVDERGGSKVDPGYVQWQKNRAEMRLKLLAKWHPKKYGDKIGVEHSGSVQLADALEQARKRLKDEDEEGK